MRDNTALIERVREGTSRQKTEWWKKIWALYTVLQGDF